MYSRFKAFVFLTLFVFGVVGFIAFLQRGSTDSPKNQPALPASVKVTKPQPAPAKPGEIAPNWRDDLGVPVLCYHQIITEAEYRKKPTPFAVTDTQFAEQMAYLAENKFYTIMPDDLLAYVRGEKQLDFKDGKRPIVLTFDDGNNDFVVHAKATLDKYGYKGVLFIYPTYIEAKPHKKRALTWSEIQSLGKAGHAIESHTMWHPNLNTMSDEEQRAQFVDSKKHLDKYGGASVRHLAYPFGVHTHRSVELLRETGYSSAYTVFHGGNQVGEDPYLLRRFLVVKGDGKKAFAQKTLARSLPYRPQDFSGGDRLDGPRDLAVKLPANLDAQKFKVRIFSTAQRFSYAPESGVMTISAIPSKKGLSVLEILYRENGVEYRANMLLNHKRQTAGARQHKRAKKSKKTKRKKSVRTDD